uniref:Uncharacterized protein n=1 Tax=Sparus aurata TaxID=8175 RepID=A0A671U1U5_SPAAU
MATDCFLFPNFLRQKYSQLTEACCHKVGQYYGLRELDLSRNNLQDSGLALLSSGLESPHCRLESLGRLSGGQVTEEGCASLASALSSNPSHLRELDLSYNHPGDSGVKLLSVRLQDPQCRLNTLRYKCSKKQVSFAFNFTLY